jgi:hypothetical protein
MFEAVILLILLGVILLYIVTGEGRQARRRTTFINLSVELRPSTEKLPRAVRAKKQ